MIKNREHFDSRILNFCYFSGAKECKSCRSRKMLQNAPFLAMRGVDTAENEPSKVSMKRGSQTGVAPVIKNRSPAPDIWLSCSEPNYILNHYAFRRTPAAAGCGTSCYCALWRVRDGPGRGFLQLKLILLA